MDPSSVLGGILPLVSRELGDVSSTDVLVSLGAVRSWQLRHRPEDCLPGVGLREIDPGAIAAAHHFLRFATSGYGWKGRVFFHATDPRASYGLDALSGLLRNAMEGDGPAFCEHARIPRDALVFESREASLGSPKHFVAVDAATHSVVLVIRGTMSLSDTLTDTATASVPFCGGAAHEGFAHAACAVFDSTAALLADQLRARGPGWGLVVTGHSLGAAAAILFVVLLKHLQAAVLRAADGAAAASDAVPACTPGPATPLPASSPAAPGRGLSLAQRSALAAALAPFSVACHTFAPPPVFCPLSALPPGVACCVTSWVHADDLVSRLRWG